MRWIICFASFALAVHCGAQDAAAQEARTYSLSPKVNLRVAGPWVESPVKYSNAMEFIVKGEVRVQVDRQAGEQAVEFPLARMLVTTEPRGSHADALKRLDDIAASRPEQARFVEIDGWPAVELEFFEALPRRGQRAGVPNEILRRAITAIAADDQVLNFDISLVPNAPADLLLAAQGVARNVSVSERPNPDAVRQEIERLQQEETARKGQQPQPRGDLVPDRGAQETLLPEPDRASPSGTGTVAVQTGFGEIEIAGSADGRNVVIAANGGLSFSTNRGATYNAATSGVFGLNDPSVARARSGNFYLAVIAFPTGAAGQLGVTGCTNAVSRSTNNGANFNLQGYSARCPLTGAGLCFPDQEHLAADAVTAGNDQLYTVWRNFTPSGPAASCGAIGSGFVTPSITCSQDNGVNWSARAAIGGAGDFPRVAVARDGTVYVVSLSGNSVLLNRFSSCATSLTPATGFPVTVATLSGGVTCPMPGLDRCNDGNTLSSPTVAADPGNAARVFVTFAESDGSGGERIVTRESTNSGASFGGPATLSGSTSARRFMPWSCSTRGRAWVGWYDRRAAKAAGATNDLTEYFVGANRGPTLNLSNRPDPQCASGWPCAPRSTQDSDSCTVQPQLAGVCQRVGGGGSGNRCDFSAGGCPAGETCQGGGGCPKYGDYNGIACAGNFVIAAWTTATSPAGLPTAAGLRVYSSTIFVGEEGASIWRYTGTPCSGDSCPGWQRLDNNPKTVAIAVAGNQVYQLHNDGWIWRYTGTACDGDFCPGWQRLDNSSKTIAIATGGDQLYQLHNDGWIWRHTGTPCTGDSCPGWQRLDNNSKTVAIAAGGSALYQLHNDGRVWRHTGTPCSGDSCPGWQLLDNNSKTVAIAAGGSALYQLHNDGRIWRFTGTPCSGASCPGWQQLDNNTKTVAIASAGSHLHQLHNDGRIWLHTGTPCTGESCPGWQQLDNNPKSVGIAATDTGLFQLHHDGWIWRYTGTPCSGSSCPGWQRLDNNPRTGMIAGGDQLYQLHTDPLYQLHNDGWIWRYTGTECDGEFCPGWQRLDNNGNTVEIAAAGSQLFQRHRDGRIWRYTGTPCNGDSCPSWQLLDDNAKTVAIAAAGNQLFQLHNDGWIWRYTGTPCSGSSCPGWQRLDNNAKTIAIAAGGNQLFQRHNDGSIWRYTGTPCSGNSCPGWQRLDNNPKTVAIAAAGNQLFQLHNDGWIWRYTGTPCSGNSCPGWQRLDNNPNTRSIAAAGTQLFQLHQDGRIWRYTGTPCSGDSCPGWQLLDNNPKTREIVASGDHLYQRHNDGWIWRYVGPPCSGESCPGWRRLDDNSKTARIVVGGSN
jgi:hypothetical protein